MGDENQNPSLEEIVSSSPLPEELPQPSTRELMSFPQAIQRVIDGKKIARESWNNVDFCLLKDGWLMIFINGEFHRWMVSDSDLLGFDWFVLEAN